MSPRFSIIIPVYNVAPYLRECLDSVLSQTFTDWEAVCVDDGSVDGSGDILDEYAAKDLRFRTVHQQNSGVSSARNMALNFALGEYLCFVDGDDWICRDYLQQLDDEISKNRNPDLIRLAGFHKLNNGGVCSKTDLPQVEKTDVMEALCSFVISNALMVLNVYRRDAIGAIRFPIGVRYGEDDIFLMRAIDGVRTVVQSNIDGYIYRYLRVGAASRMLTCKDMALLFMHLRDEILSHLGKGRNELVLMRLYREFARKEIFRVLSRSSREGSEQMRTQLVECISRLGDFTAGWLWIDKFWLNRYLRSGSWVCCDVVQCVKSSIKLPFRLVKHILRKER